VAEENKKRGYPKIARNNWFALREKFKQKVPGEVSANYVASTMGMTQASAQANILPPLRAFGLIEESGKPTELAYEWRDDEKYAQVCATLIENTYPQSIRDAFHSPDAPLKNVVSWFAREGKVGDSAATMHAKTYLMLLEADPAGGKETAPARAKPATKSSPGTTKPATSKLAKSTVLAEVNGSMPLPQQPPEHEKAHTFSPKIHIDVQIHISPESSADQIDKIFESMARHLKDFRS
jgi:hypothetical protein